VHYALERLKHDLSDSEREEVLHGLRGHLGEIRSRRVPSA
jgi:hypothetical protein